MSAVEATKAFDSFCKKNSGLISCETRTASYLDRKEKIDFIRGLIKHHPCGVASEEIINKNTSIVFVYYPINK